MIPFAANAAGAAATKIANGPDNPQNFVTLPEEDRSTAIGNMHRKLGKDRTCGSGDILTDRQTDRQTHTHRHTHYDTSAPLRGAK